MYGGLSVFPTSFCPTRFHKMNPRKTQFIRTRLPPVLLSVHLPPPPFLSFTLSMFGPAFYGAFSGPWRIVDCCSPFHQVVFLPIHAFGCVYLFHEGRQGRRLLFDFFRGDQFSFLPPLLSPIRRESLLDVFLSHFPLSLLFSSDIKIVFSPL